MPIADWGLRSPVVGAPVKVTVEPRAIDRARVARAATGSGAAEIALVRLRLGVFGLGTQSVGLALMDCDKMTGDLTASDLVQ